jgi:tetratricopeptide (TPR) repeat protein
MKTAPGEQRGEDSTSADATLPVEIRRKQPNLISATLVPNATVFISSLCLMVVEIVAARLIARDIGNSLYTWTSIIGVILTGMSLGNYLGGLLADRTNPVKTLPNLFMLAAISCLLVLVLSVWVSQWELLWYLTWPVRIALHVAFVFMLPATLLGAISPVVAKRALDLSRQTGRTVGGLYAWGAIGSIVGTFLAGFVLVAASGTRTCFCMVAVVLAVMGILYARRRVMAYAVAVICLAALWGSSGKSALAVATGEMASLRDLQDPAIVFHTESQYQYVEVRRDPQPPHVTTMRLDKLRHSQVIPDDPYNLQYGYERIYAAVTHRSARGMKKITALVIGGGGYTYPLYLAHHFPGSHIEVAEIDPVVTQAAIEGMCLPADNDLSIHNIDAGNHVADLIRRKQRGEPVVEFNFVYGDSINDFAVPFHLVTREFNEKIRELLTPDGIYMLNMIDSLHSARFLGAVINTMQETFPHVVVLTDRPVVDDWRIRDTFVIIASRQPVDCRDLGREYPENPRLTCRVMPDEQMALACARAKGAVLTDDFAPVENLLAPVVRATQDNVAKHLYAKAEDYYRKSIAPPDEGASPHTREALRETVGYCERALHADPEDDHAYNLMAIALVRLGEYPRAFEAFEAAVRINPKVGEVHASWGMALAQVGRWEEAIERLGHAAQLDPDLRPLALAGIGDVLSAMGRADEAQDYYRQAEEARGVAEGE